MKKKILITPEGMYNIKDKVEGIFGSDFELDFSARAVFQVIPNFHRGMTDSWLVKRNGVMLVCDQFRGLFWNPPLIDIIKMIRPIRIKPPQSNSLGNSGMGTFLSFL